MAEWNFQDWATTNPFLAQEMETLPEAAYYSATPFAGGYSPAAQRYWSGQFGNLQNQYMGEWGRQYRAGEDPLKQGYTFTEFLSDYPWTERYTALGPRLRPGAGTSRFAPAARRMY